MLFALVGTVLLVLLPLPSYAPNGDNVAATCMLDADEDPYTYAVTVSATSHKGGGIAKVTISLNDSDSSSEDYYSTGPPYVKSVSIVDSITTNTPATSLTAEVVDKQGKTQLTTTVDC